MDEEEVKAVYQEIVESWKAMKAHVWLVGCEDRDKAVAGWNEWISLCDSRENKTRFQRQLDALMIAEIERRDVLKRTGTDITKEKK